MPIPKPSPNETKKDFIQRCMSDPIMKKEYKEQDQRYSICVAQFSK